mmetsp:Transcript_28191/g.81663  ORF Transcript_28191/g.81663 Transcript_28191/m.81663 type:complete len:250 (+) Transcript_28191:525-1274(+)
MTRRLSSSASRAGSGSSCCRSASSPWLGAAYGSSHRRWSASSPAMGAPQPHPRPTSRSRCACSSIGPWTRRSPTWPPSTGVPAPSAVRPRIARNSSPSPRERSFATASMWLRSPRKRGALPECPSSQTSAPPSSPPPTLRASSHSHPRMTAAGSSAAAAPQSVTMRRGPRRCESRTPVAIGPTGDPTRSAALGRQWMLEASLSSTMRKAAQHSSPATASPSPASASQVGTARCSSAGASTVGARTTRVG